MTNRRGGNLLPNRRFHHDSAHDLLLRLLLCGIRRSRPDDDEAVLGKRRGRSLLRRHLDLLSTMPELDGLLLVVGYPAPDAQVPDLERKALDEVAIWNPGVGEG